MQLCIGTESVTVRRVGEMPMAGGALHALTRSVYATASVGLRKSGELMLAQTFQKTSAGVGQQSSPFPFSYVKARTKIQLAEASRTLQDAEDVKWAAKTLHKALEYLKARETCTKPCQVATWISTATPGREAFV